MSAVEDSIHRLHSVRSSIDGGRNQISSASEELEKHQGTIAQASGAIEGAAASTVNAADGLEQLASATRALSYDSTAATVENAKERVEHAADHLRAAKEHVAQAASAVGAARETLGETSGTLAESDTAVEEALTRLSSLPLSGGGSSGSGGREAEVLAGLRWKLPRDHGRVRRPCRRHRFNRIASSGSPKNENAVLLPYVDDAADTESIKSGQAIWDPANNCYHVNGRMYVSKREKGRREPILFPVGGDGVIPLSRPEYKAFKGLAVAGGDRDRIGDEYRRSRDIRDSHWEKASEVYRIGMRHGDQGGSN